MPSILQAQDSSAALRYFTATLAQASGGEFYSFNAFWIGGSFLNIFTWVPYLFGSGVTWMFFPRSPVGSPLCAGADWGNLFGSGVTWMFFPRSPVGPLCAGSDWGNLFGSGVTWMDFPSSPVGPLCAGAGWESSKLAARTLRRTVPVFLARSAARPLAKATLYINSSDWL